jgi:hypothetical protein
MTPEKKYVWIGYGVVLVGIGAAVYLAFHFNSPPIVVGEGFAPFAVLYIVAQGLERLLQPASEIYAGGKEKKEIKADLLAGKDTPENRRKLLQLEADRAVIFWAVASILALLACGFLGLGLIQSIANVGGGNVPDWFNAIDIVITGLAVGAGTKPLHDLIGVIQNTKQKTDPALQKPSEENPPPAPAPAE